MIEHCLIEDSKYFSTVTSREKVSIFTVVFAAVFRNYQKLKYLNVNQFASVLSTKSFLSDCKLAIAIIFDVCFLNCIDVRNNNNC